MVTLAQGGQGSRLRAAVDRMHAAQLAALAVLTSSGPPQERGAPGAAAAPAVPEAREARDAPGVPGTPGMPAAPEGNPVAGCDVYGAERQLLAQVAEMGSLLVRLGLLAQADVEAVEVRRRLVTLAVACGNTLAELVTLAFEVAGVSDEAGGMAAANAARPPDAADAPDAQAAAGRL
jgi:hypothetical protein